MNASNPRDEAASRQALVFAIAHEVGNHVGAIRLQAHLLDEDLDGRALAESSVMIDRLAGRTGPLLALIRPILSDEPETGPGTPWSVVLGRLRQHLDDAGTHGVDVTIDASGDPDSVTPAAEWLPSLLLALIEATLSGVPKRGSIRISLEATEEEATLVIEDDGEEEDLSPGAPLRGRPLVVGLARRLTLLVDGSVDARREGGRTAVTMRIPVRR